jgi:hypothetical protein
LRNLIGCLDEFRRLCRGDLKDEEVEIARKDCPESLSKRESVEFDWHDEKKNLMELLMLTYEKELQ